MIGGSGGGALPLLLGAAGRLVNIVRRLTGGVGSPLGRVGGLLEKAGCGVPGPVGGLSGLLLVAALIAGGHLSQLVQQPDHADNFAKPEGHDKQQKTNPHPFAPVVGVSGRLMAAGRGSPPTGTVAVVIVIGIVVL